MEERLKIIGNYYIDVAVEYALHSEEYQGLPQQPLIFYTFISSFFLKASQI